ncbi:hypothetical protein [Stakelama tenebrarum]|uniref:Secreted protein n=1 Tax=Stakelama tenebrarum TaxID=2711215 RepID=A0A6G6Y9U6_9SPHN|nr:hypothetical protein [Sphingosinithalassobacter tenebrarum]QIG81346.1 hypothetical protein G5C33_17190 [Sphingosinithalassobacter tenebrarum]
MPIALMLFLAVPQDVPAQAADTDATVTRPETGEDGTQRWSVLAAPCATQRTAAQDEIVVCGERAEGSARLPLPGERAPPDRPMPSNPELSGRGALAATVAPCATRSQGCTTGINLFGAGTALIRGLGKLTGVDDCCEAPGEATNPFALVGDIGSALGLGGNDEPIAGERIAIPLGKVDPDEAAASVPILP